MFGLNKYIIALILLLLFLIPIILFLIGNSARIQVKNESNYFTLRYKQSSTFNTYLKKWRVFDELIQKKSNSQKWRGVKKINVILTDRLQPDIFLTDKDNKPLITNSSTLDESHIFTIVIQIDPKLKQQTADRMNKSVTLTVLNSVYQILPKSISKGLEKDFTKAYSTLSEKGKETFVISSK